MRGRFGLRPPRAPLGNVIFLPHDLPAQIKPSPILVSITTGKKITGKKIGERDQAVVDSPGSRRWATTLLVRPAQFVVDG
jgi:hypothetical protein